MKETAYILIIMGIIMLLAGLFLYWGGSVFHWLGNLPGDIRIEGKNYTVYLPFTTMILMSLLLNVLYRLIRIFF